jgi:hypothetical protein
MSQLLTNIFPLESSVDMHLSVAYVLIDRRDEVSVLEGIILSLTSACVSRL